MSRVEQSAVCAAYLQILRRIVWVQQWPHRSLETDFLGAKWPAFDFRQDQIFSLTCLVRMGCAFDSSFQWVPLVKRVEREAVNSLPSRVMVSRWDLNKSSPCARGRNTISMQGCSCLASVLFLGLRFEIVVSRYV
jgi:hypothetical protein